MFLAVLKHAQRDLPRKGLQPAVPGARAAGKLHDQKDPGGAVQLLQTLGDVRVPPREHVLGLSVLSPIFGLLLLLLSVFCLFFGQPRRKHIFLWVCLESHC